MNETEIKVELFQVCVDAQDNGPAGLNITGLTDTIRPPLYPCSIDRLAIVLRFRLPFLPKVTGKLALQVVDPDDAIVWEESGTVDLFTQKSIEEPETAVTNGIYKLQNLWIKAAGCYEIRALWNDAQVAATPLFLFYPDHQPVAGDKQ